jgi:hypothetical protein
MTSPNAQKIPEPKLPIQAATRERAIDSLIARLRPLTSKSIRALAKKVSKSIFLSICCCSACSS